MAKVRDLLVSVSVDTAKRQRKCHRNSSHAVIAGQRCLMIKDSAGQGHKNYCISCAREILEAASRKITMLNTELLSEEGSRAAAGQVRLDRL
jgi:hypothetical protein